ncbi:hypothetical protein SDC9_177006 [bioreactor metagenome]|uniref:Uncharacterized protein n=1 Tax=bioreactor metagenome TaxID=1076179 RepID=A0A645H111_9ZZZZ
MRECGGGNQGDIHGQPRHRGLTRGMQGDMANAERVSRGVKWHNLLADAKQFPIVALFHRLGKEQALRLYGTLFQFFLRDGHIVQQRVKRRLPLRIHEAGERG